MSDKNTSADRRRNIAWSYEVDAIAVRLAAERGCERGVSELLEQLVLEERKNPRLKLVDPTPGYAAHISKAEELRDEIRQRSGKVQGETLKKKKK